MQIEFIKHADKPPTLACLRDDGSRTWFRSQGAGAFFVEHDLLHYAVETTLGYTTAFYGMVAAGRDINDFGSQGGEKDERPFTDEASYAETIIGLIQRLFRPGSQPDFALFQGVLGDLDLPRKPKVTEEQVIQAHACWCALLAEWEALPAGEALRLTFELPSAAGTG